MEDHSLCQQSRYCAFTWEGQSTEESKKAKMSSNPNVGHTNWTSTYFEVVWALITYAELWEVTQGCHQQTDRASSGEVLVRVRKSNWKLFCPGLQKRRKCLTDGIQKDLCVMTNFEFCSFVKCEFSTLCQALFLLLHTAEPFSIFHMYF